MTTQPLSRVTQAHDRCGGAQGWALAGADGEARCDPAHGELSQNGWQPAAYGPRRPARGPLAVSARATAAAARTSGSGWQPFGCRLLGELPEMDLGVAEMAHRARERARRAGPARQ